MILLGLALGFIAGVVLERRAQTAVDWRELHEQRIVHGCEERHHMRPVN